MHARCHAGWSTPAGARTAAIAGAFRRSHRRALRWPAPAEPRAESGTAARTAGSRGGRPGPATTEVDQHARRYARRAGQAAGGRTDEQVSARHEAASRADQAAGARRSAWTAAGQHSALGGWSGEQARAVRTLPSHGACHPRSGLSKRPARVSTDRQAVCDSARRAAPPVRSHTGPAAQADTARGVHVFPSTRQLAPRGQ